MFIKYAGKVKSMDVRKLAVLAVLAPLFCGCRGGRTARWEVLLMGLPEEIHVSKAAEGPTYYILKQTHEPLFRRGDGENYDSRLLKSWRRDVVSRRFLFCPDTSRRFNSSSAFSAGYFQGYIGAVTRRFGQEFALSRDGDCTEVIFGSSQKKYLDFLVLYENAPTEKQSDKVEVGLGEFYVSEMGAGKIVLTRKTRVANGFSEVVLHEYFPEKSGEYDYSRISDFNKVPFRDIPPEILRTHSGFDNIELSSDVLMINHPDIEARKRIYNCLDVSRFRSAFFTEKKVFYSISSILPVGVTGAATGLPEQNCGFRGRYSGKDREVVLFNHRSNNIGQLAALSKDFEARSGLKLKIFSRPPLELGKLLDKSPRLYNMVVIGIGTRVPDYELFFSYFVRKDGYFDSPSPVLKSLYREVVRETSPERKNLLVQRFVREIRDQFLALPLYQNVRKVYYPREIKNLFVGREFEETPEVADFRL